MERLSENGSISIYLDGEGSNTVMQHALNQAYGKANELGIAITSYVVNLYGKQPVKAVEKTKADKV